MQFFLLFFVLIEKDKKKHTYTHTWWTGNEKQYIFSCVWSHTCQFEFIDNNFSFVYSAAAAAIIIFVYLFFFHFCIGYNLVSHIFILKIVRKAFETYKIVKWWHMSDINVAYLCSITYLSGQIFKWHLFVCQPFIEFEQSSNRPSSQFAKQQAITFLPRLFLSSSSNYCPRNFHWFSVEQHTLLLSVSLTLSVRVCVGVFLSSCFSSV